MVLMKVPSFSNSGFTKSIPIAVHYLLFNLTQTYTECNFWKSYDRFEE